MRLNATACVRRFGLGAFLFFFLKGCVWLVILVAAGMGAAGL